MIPLLLMILVFVGYILMYKLYGKFLAGKIFSIVDSNKVPSVELRDGMDYVPTKKQVIFGHHFASIAGTGPIVGPAIAIIWGWVPAILWIFFGSIFMGAVHDFGTLIISMRNQGKSISEYTAKYINNRTKIFFFIIVFLELWIVISIFGLIIAIIFKMYPASVLPVWLQIPIAMTLGYLIYKKSRNITLSTLIAVAIMYITVILGNYFPIEMPDFINIPSTGVWTIILLVYVFFASVLPVTTLLQPRDYINSYQLIIAMALLIIGIIISAFSHNLQLVAPAIQFSPAEAPPMLPLLFITIACGAISGFHSLVSSGTSSKQVSNEKDSLFIGYGSMLMEGALATLVLIAVAAGIGMGYNTETGETLFGVQAWASHYSSWNAAGGLESKITAFVDGAANMIGSSGIPREISIVIMGVFVASFAGTTLDTATRIQRYVISEILRSPSPNKSIPRPLPKGKGEKPIPSGDGEGSRDEARLVSTIFSNRYFITFLVVASAAILAFATGADGGGALKLWPLFGAVNQTLAALALIIVTLYLKSKGGIKWLVSGIPAIFMSIITLWATIMNQLEFYGEHNLLLQIINAIIIIIVVWITIEGVFKFFHLHSKK